MKTILRYMKPYRWKITWGVSVKFLGSMGELLIPFLLEYMVDEIVPTESMKKVLLFGAFMVFCAILVRQLNIYANQWASRIARDCTNDLRRDLFAVTTRLTGAQFDSVTLPSLISRMTADSYNVQNFIGMIQRMGIRAPILLTGGVIMAMLLDMKLSMVLLLMVPLMAGVVLFVSRHGVPLYNTVQENVDRLTRILRENITGIRVVKALSREEYEKARYDKVNNELARSDFKAGATMALPNPLMNLFLNVGLVFVILYGAHRVNEGGIKAGVIITFLVYFNLILGAVLGINRIFIMYTKAGASANRACCCSPPSPRPCFAPGRKSRPTPWPSRICTPCRTRSPGWHRRCCPNPWTPREAASNRFCGASAAPSPVPAEAPGSCCMPMKAG